MPAVQDDPPGGSPRHRSRHRWLLALPALALAWPGLYNHEHPRIFGVPFFYAYQLAVIFLAAAVMGLAEHRRR